MMTSTEQEAFFRFKMKVIPLAIKVFIARGDYDTVRPMQPLKPGEMVFDEAGKLHEVVAAPVLDTQRKIDRLVANVGSMSMFSYKSYFGTPPQDAMSLEGLQAYARQRLEKQDEGVHLLNVDCIYEDAEGNGELEIP